MAQAVENGKSIMPRDLIRAMAAGHYDGMAQDYGFTEQGELTAPDINIFQVKDLSEIAQILRRFAAGLGLEEHGGKEGQDAAGPSSAQ